MLRIVAVIFPDTESTDRRRLTDDLPPTVEVARSAIQIPLAKDAHLALVLLRLSHLESRPSLSSLGQVDFRSDLEEREHHAILERRLRSSLDLGVTANTFTEYLTAAGIDVTVLKVHRALRSPSAEG